MSAFARFTAEVVRAELSFVCFYVPPDAVAALGIRGRTPVHLTINGYETISTTQPAEGGRMRLIVNREMRAATGLNVGDCANVSLSVSDTPRPIDIPAELAALLKRNPVAKARFDRMPSSHQRETCTAIAEAKTAETRSRRAQKAIDRLLTQ